ncbi:unnamed protein product [Urochloa humidicola]
MATKPLLSAAARHCSRSASAVIRRDVIESHNLTLDGCAAFREIPRTKYASSKTFEAAGHRWRIRWYPNGAEKLGWLASGHMSFFLELDNAYGNTDPVNFRFSLLDHAGNPVHSQAMEGRVFSCERWSDKPKCEGFHNFMNWKDLEESGCLKDDKFTIRCDISGVKWMETETADAGDGTAAPVAPPPPRVVVPPSNLHEHLYDLLWKKQGVDVAIDVAGESFEAHGWMLKARAPVLEAELPAATKEKEKAPVGGGARRRMEIQGMEPKVLKAMLHFIYTDVLPEMKEHETVAMAQGLLVAAHRYKIEKLKLMCEELLCKHIDVSTVAMTLVVAEEHGCHALKAACLEFMGRPGIAKAVMASEGFEKVKASCLPLMMELVVTKKLD